MASDERWDWRHGEASGEQAFAATRPMFGTVDSHNHYQACCSAHVSLQDRAKTHTVIWLQGWQRLSGPPRACVCLHSGSTLYLNSQQVVSTWGRHLAPRLWGGMRAVDAGAAVQKYSCLAFSQKGLAGAPETSWGLPRAHLDLQGESTRLAC